MPSIILGYARLILIVLLLPLYQGCSSERTSPEEQIRQMLTAGELAVESRSVTAVQAFLSEQYADESGNQKRTLSRLLTGYFIGHQSIHLLIQIESVRLLGDKRAEVMLYVATAGKPIHSAADFVSLRADLLRFEFKLIREETQWRVISANWRRADLQDFLK